MPNTHKHQCCAAIDKAHIKQGTYAGKNRKPEGREVPLCRIHHSIQHNMGEKKFWGKRLDDAIALAGKLSRLTDQDDALTEVFKFVFGRA